MSLIVSITLLVEKRIQIIFKVFNNAWCTFLKYLHKLFLRMNFTYQMRACTFCFLLSSSDRNTSSHLHAHNRSVSKGEAKTYFRALLHCVDTNRKKRKHKIDKWIITTVKMWHDYCVQISQIHFYIDVPKIPTQHPQLSMLLPFSAFSFSH